MTTRELERLLGHPLKPKWTMVLAANGQLFVRETDGSWYAVDGEPPAPTPSRKTVAA